MFYTSFSAFARGVLIWIRAEVPFQGTSSLIDPGGRYVAVMGRLGGRDVALVNVYAPNAEQGEFLAKLSHKLADYLVCLVIVGGDFNCVADPSLDRSHPPLRNSPVNRLADLFSTWQTR